jgi:microcystin-dependent protein/subtilisin-like proprotein convertase family protein
LGAASLGARRLHLEPLEQRTLLATGLTGGGQPHDNMQPSLATDYIIAMVGQFPSTSGLTDSPFLGEVTPYAGNFAPPGWVFAEGQLLPINQNQALFSILGTMYGGDGRTNFALPDLRGRVAIGDGQAPGLTPRSIGQKTGVEQVTLTEAQLAAHSHTLSLSGVTGGSQPHENMQPSLALNPIIATAGLFPSPGGYTESPFLGEITLFAGNFAPGGWESTDGQLLSISGNDALFSILGTTYGGDGQTTFGLPDLRGRAVIGEGVAPGLTSRHMGEETGVEQVTLTEAQLPAHTHTLPPSSVVTGVTGGNQPLDNVQPSLALNYIIQTDGVYEDLGTIRPFASFFAPGGWESADGQLLTIADNSALFSILGTTYGGDGVDTFALPDLRGRTAIGRGWGPGLTPRPLGQQTGAEQVTLTEAQMAAHSHTLPPWAEIRGTKWNDVDGDGSRDPEDTGLSGWTVFADLNGNGLVDVGGAAGTFASADLPKAITDGNTTTSDLMVSGLPGVIVDVNVTLDITHTFDADLEVSLVSPEGSRIWLFAGVGGGGDNFTGTTLDDQAATPIYMGAAPFAGTYQPETPLSGLAGEDPSGLWRLEVHDWAGADQGTLNDWSLEVSSGPEPSAVTDADGNYVLVLDGLNPAVFPVTVTEVLLDGWGQTHPTPGTYSVTLVPGQVVEGVDFGNHWNVDFGDAPDSNQSGFAGSYPVTLAEDGARHNPAGPILGASRDTEAAGVHSAGADADDTSGVPDDEDGVSISPMVPRASATATVTVTGGAGLLDAWIDFGGDGAFDEPGDRITAVGGTQVNDAAPNTIPFSVPAGFTGTTYARFRLSTTGGLDATGEASDGEVEDYQVTISLPSTVYVDDDWAGTPIGEDPDPGDGIPMAFGFDAFATIQEGVDMVAADGTVNVAAGSYGGIVTAQDMVISGTGVPGEVVIEGASPALTVNAGDIIVQNGVTLQTSTDDPTVLVNGGSLTVTNSLIHETDGFDRPAFEINGGTVDLGTTGTPGGNAINIRGAGRLIDNLAAAGVSAVGNTWQQDGADVTDNFTIEDEINHALDNAAYGLVTWVADNVYVTTNTLGIQRGIDAATAGDTVNVNDGAYAEDPVVNKANLTIQSATGRDNTTIQLVSGVGIDVQAGGSGLTLGGANRGFEILSGATTSRLVELAGGLSDVTISYNKLDTSGPAWGGVYVPSGAAGLTIDQNVFVAGETSDSSVTGHGIVDLRVRDNNFIGAGAAPVAAFAIDVEAVTNSALSESVISGNRIEHYPLGIRVISGWTGTSDLKIDGNTLNGCNTAIRLSQRFPNADMTRVTVTNNTMTGCDTGLSVGGGAQVLASTFTIQNNTFTGNTFGFASGHATEVVELSQNDFSGNTTAVEAGGAAAVDARLNWWGDASGPSGQGPGSGDAVSTNVIYSPWLGATTGTSPMTYRVDPSSPTALEDAYDAAADGDTILAMPGTYNGFLADDAKEVTLDTTAGGVVIEGASYALDVSAGQVIVQNGVTFNQGTGFDTIRVQGAGDLTLIDCVVNESSVGAHAAIQVLAGGVLDLSSDDNTINVDGGGGGGRLLDYQDATALDATGTTLTLDGGAFADNFAIEDAIDHALDSAAYGLVTWVAGNVYVTTNTLGIQRGIDVATAGDTINVNGGTYTGDLVINKANLTLRSKTGRDNTTIQLVDGVGIDIRGGGFTLGGAADRGFTVDDGAATTFLIQLANGPADVTLSYNALDMTGNAGMGVSVGAAGATGLTVDNNTVVAGDGDGGMFGVEVVDLSVTANTLSITGGGEQTSGYGIEFFGVTGNSLIDGNTVTGYSNGILLAQGASNVEGVLVSNNVISRHNSGIRLANSGLAGAITGVTIVDNSVTNEQSGGIDVRVGSPGQALSGIAIGVDTVDPGTDPNDNGDADVRVDGNLTMNQSIITAGGKVDFNGTVTTAGGPVEVDTTDAGATPAGAEVRFDGAVTFGAGIDVSVSSGESDTTFTANGTVDGPAALVVNNSATTTFDGVIGGSAAITSLTTDNAGGLDEKTEIGTAIVNADGPAVTLNDPVILKNNLTITESGTGAVTFNSTVDRDAAGAWNLTVNSSSGTTTVNGAVNAQAVEFNGGNAEFAGAVGSGPNGAIGILTVSGGAGAGCGLNLGNDVTTSGDQTYNVAVCLTNDVTLTADTVTFNNTVDATTADQESLTINGNAVIGDALGDDMGGAVPLEFLTIDGTDVVVNANVTVAGNIDVTVTNNLTVAAGLTVRADSDQSGGGTLTVTAGDLTAAADSTLRGHTVNVFGGNVTTGNVVADVGDVTITPANATTNGAVTATVAQVLITAGGTAAVNALVSAGSNVEIIGTDVFVNADVTADGWVDLMAHDNVTVAAGVTVRAGIAVIVSADLINDNVGDLTAAADSTLRGHRVVLTGQNVTVGNVTADGLDVTITAQSDATINGDVSAARDVDVEAIGNIALGGGITAVNTVFLQAGGAIVDNNGVAMNVTAPQLAAAAGAGIGSADPVETDVDVLAAWNQTSGHVKFDNDDVDQSAADGLLTIGSVDSLAGVTNNAAGQEVVIFNGFPPNGPNPNPINVDNDVTADGNVTLTAVDTPDVGVDNVRIESLAVVRSVAGRVTFNVGDNFDLPPTAAVWANTEIMIHGDNPGGQDPDVDSGSVVTIQGILSAPQAMVSTGADNDTMEVDLATAILDVVTLIYDPNGGDADLLIIGGTDGSEGYCIDDPAGAVGRNGLGLMQYVNLEIFDLNTRGGNDLTTFRMRAGGPGLNTVEVNGGSHSGSAGLLDAFKVVGSSAGDNVVVRPEGAAAPAGPNAQFWIGGIESLQLFGGAGADTMSNETNVESLMVGGDGPDVLFGANNAPGDPADPSGDRGDQASDILFGGGGQDELYGDVESDFLFPDHDLLPDETTPLDIVFGETVIGGPGVDVIVAYGDTVVEGDGGIIVNAGGTISVKDWLLARFVKPTDENVASLINEALASAWTEPFNTCSPDPVEPPAARSLGPLDFQELAGQDLTLDGLWYTFETTLTGYLTALAEGDCDDVSLELYDADGNLLLSSCDLGTAGRIDWLTLANKTYYLKVTGSGQIDLLLANLVSKTGLEVKAYGTGGDDQFEFDASASRLVSVNGVSYHFEDYEVDKVTISGGDGSDEAYLHGSDGDETAKLRPGQAELTDDVYSLTASDVENVVADGGRGDDVVILYDDPATQDVFKATPDYAALYNQAFHNSAVDFRYVHGASSGGGDVAKLYDDATTRDTLKATPDYAVLHNDRFYSRAVGFRYVHAASSGGGDVAKLYDDPTTQDRFRATPNDGALYNHDFYNRAIGFRYVHAASTGGDDVAQLYDDPATQDRFVASPEEGALYNHTFYNRAVGFRYVHAASTGGDDVAKLTDDATTQDRFRATPEEGVLYNHDFYNRALGFRYVHAGSSGGDDVAKLTDNPDTRDTFRATPDEGVLYNHTFYNRAVGFRYVHAGSSGGGDMARLYDNPGTEDVFEATPEEGTLYNHAFFNRAVGFRNVVAHSSADGQDRAYLYDSALEDYLQAEGDWARLANDAAGFANWAVSFSSVEATLSSADDKEEVENAVDFLITHKEW